MVADGARVWVPTPDALFAMGRGWEHVRVVPNGALAGLPRRNIESSSPTPGSLVFPPDHVKYYPLRDTGASWAAWSQHKEVRLIEVRGWLRFVGGSCNQESGWHDWHYDLEVDAPWAARQGIDLGRLLRVGNVLEHCREAEHDVAFRRVVSLPLLHVELNGIIDDGRFRPSDWRTTGQAGCERTRWPFPPGHPPNSEELAEAKYVRMVGSLLADSPHVDEDLLGTWWAGRFGTGDEKERRRAALVAWGGTSDTDPNHDGRWTEMHPPDLIETVQRDPAERVETVRGVAVVAENGLVSGETQTLDVAIRPPQPRPRKSKPGVVEAVGPETNFRTIVEGNDAKTGARITVLDDHVRVRVTVQGQGGWGAPGKFKAIYRVFWAYDPTVPDDMVARVEPYPVPLNVASQVVVRAENAWTREPVDGQVIVNGQAVARTNVPFTFTFRTTRRRVRDPETGAWTFVPVPPTGSVTAAGYATVGLDFGLEAAP